MAWCINSSPASTLSLYIYTRRWTGSSMSQIMLCRLFVAKPTKPIMPSVNHTQGTDFNDKNIETSQFPLMKLKFDRHFMPTNYLIHSSPQSYIAIWRYWARLRELTLRQMILNTDLNIREKGDITQQRCKSSLTHWGSVTHKYVFISSGNDLSHVRRLLINLSNGDLLLIDFKDDTGLFLSWNIFYDLAAILYRPQCTLV